MTLPKKIDFDWGFNFGNVLTIVIILVSMMSTFFMQRAKVVEIERRVDMVEILTNTDRARIMEIERQTRDLYLSKEVADQIISRLERMDNRLERIEQRGN